MANVYQLDATVADSSMGALYKGSDKVSVLPTYAAKMQYAEVGGWQKHLTKVEAVPNPGYTFTGWTGHTECLVAGKASVPVLYNSSYIGSNLNNDEATAAKFAGTIVANFRKKTAADNYNIYLRWTSTLSESEGGSEVTRTYRVTKASSTSSNLELRVFVSTSNVRLNGISGNSMYRAKSGEVYFANYFPRDNGGNYWVAPNAGAKRKSGERLVGWELRSSANGAVLAVLPPDGSTAIAEIAQMLDNADAPWGSNSLGDYRMAYLTAVWADLRVTVDSTGAEGEDEPPAVSSEYSMYAPGGMVNLTAQASGLATCDFSEWTATDGSGSPLVVTPGEEAGTASFEMPDSDVTATAVYQQRAMYTIAAAQVDGKDVVDLSFDPAPVTVVGGVGYWAKGTVVAVTVTPRAGYLLNGGGISVNGTSQGSFTNSDPSAPYTFELVVTGETVVVPVVSTQTFACTATIDGASAATGAITSASASAPSVAYGGSVTFTAVMDEDLVDEGFSFAGWYDADGELVDSELSHTESDITAPISLVAKAAAVVRLSTTGAEQAHAALFVDGVECVEGSYSETLAVGTSISYELSIDDGYGLDAWRAGSDILPLGVSGTIYIDAPVAAEATILGNDDLDRKVTVYSLDVNGDPLEIGDDFISFTDVTQAASTTNASVLALSASSGDQAEEPANVCVGSFTGTRLTRATAAQTAASGGSTLYFLGWYEQAASSSPISRSLSLDILTSSNKTFYVRYAASGTATVFVGETEDSGDLSGSVWIGESGSDVSVEVSLGARVIVHARARNGYRFDGWYGRPDPVVFTPESKEPDLEITVYGKTERYARFVIDRNAICEWEGSDKNKTMVWRSKTYEASKPFNPSSCRVDARGYRPSAMLDLTVDMFSAPDADARPTAHVTLSNIASQDARRLPVRRMERYMQVEVVADSEVDALLVGTSMGGLVV